MNDASRKPQLEYSTLQHKTFDEPKRRRKAEKIVTVLQHFLGTDDLAGLTAVDVGCSTGYTVDALRAAGADAVGLDIDIPGLQHASTLFGDDAHFMCADGSRLPFADRSIDVVVFNHIYEHVVDPDAVVAEIRRVLKEDGVGYFAFGNRYQVIEPHYRLPFLSWLPPRVADRYVARSGRAESYYERFRSRAGLVEMCEGLRLWDYTYSVLGDATYFRATDMVPARLRGLPPRAWHALAPVMPTFIWIATPGAARPATGRPLREAPSRVRG